MSKYNSFFNNYATYEWSFVDFPGAVNLILLGNTYSSDDGGCLVNSEMFSSGSYSNVNTDNRLANMYSSCMLTIAGNYAHPNLSYSGSWVQGDVAAIRWSGEDGLLNLTAHAGGDVLGTGQYDANSQVSDAGILIKVTNNMHNARGFNATNMETPAQNISAYGFYGSGNLTLKSDMSATIQVDSGVTRENLMSGYYTVDSNGALSLHSLSSGNVVESSAFKSVSLFFDNSFNGVIDVQSSLDAISYAAPTADSNKISAIGMLASDTISLENGIWSGKITVQSIGNQFFGDYNLLGNSDDKNNSSVSGNSVVVYGIQAATVNISEFTGSINAVVQDNQFISICNPAVEKPSCTVSNNEVLAAGIKASTLNIAGDYAGAIQVENSKIGQSYDMGSLSASGNKAIARGIDVSTLKVGGSLRGSIELVTNDISLLASPGNSYNVSATAINAPTITVGGYIATDMVMSCVGSVYGINATSITAQAFTGNIDIDFSVGVSDGIRIVSGLFNYTDNVFDFAGSVKSTRLGIGGFASGMSLRVSGSIESDGYALLAGSSSGTTVTFSNQNDFLEVAAGAVIKGTIELTNRENNMIVDSNARIEGYVLSTGGKLNLTFMLNDRAMSNVTAANDNAVISAPTRDGAALFSTTSITINLNDVELENGQAKTYYLVNDNSSDWTNRQIAFAYQNQLVYAKVGTRVTAKDGSFTASSYYTHDKGFFVVIESKEEKADLDYRAPVASHRVIADDDTVLVEWNSVSEAVAYELEYRIDGGKTITVMLDNTNTKYNITDVVDGQRLEYRIRTHYSEYRNFSDWSDEKSAVMTEQIHTVANTNALAWINNPDSDALTSSATMEFAWEGFEFSSVLGYYEIRYYLSNDGAVPEWDELEFGTTLNYYHKYTTAEEIVVTGFNDSEYIHWQVRAVDIHGNASDWIDGDSFQIMLGDNKPPVIETVESSVVYDTNVEPGEDGFIKATLSWSGYDPAGGSGVRDFYIRYREVSYNDAGQKVYGEWAPTLKLDAAIYSSYTFELPNGEYEWEVYSTDFAGNHSDKISGSWVGDVEAPVFDGGALWNISWDALNTVLLVNGSWHEATDEGSGLKLYRLSYTDINGDGSWITVDCDIDTNNIKLQLTNGEYRWKLEAIDFAGNITEVANHGNWVGDVEAPVFEDPDHLFSSVRENEKGEKVVDFEWSTAYEPRTLICTGFSHYELVITTDIDGDGELDEVLRKKISGQYNTSTTVSALLDGIDLSTNNKYTWSVEAYDIGGNKSVASNSDFVIDFTPPSGSFEDDTTTTIDCVWSSRIEQKFGTSKVVDYISDITITLDFNAEHHDDLSGVRYQVQICADPKFSGSTLKTYYTDTTELIFDGGSGTLNGHENAGELLGMSQFYWRVRAIDGSGNASDVWFLGNNGEPIRMEDTNRLDEDLKPSRIEDNTAPDFSTSDEVYFSWDLDGGLYISWDGAHDAFGVKQYYLHLVRETAYPNDLPLVEYETMDSSYSNVGSITRYASNSYIITTSTGNNWVALDNLPDGKYTLLIKAVDFANNACEDWVQIEDTITIDTHGPTLDTTSVKCQVAGNDAYITWDAALDLVGVEKYELTYKKFNETTLAYEKVQTVTIAGAEKSFWLYNLTAGDYCFTLQAFDTNTHSSNSFGQSFNGSDISPSSMFTIEGTDAGNSFAKATVMTNSEVYSDAVSHADTADFYTISLAGNGQVAFSLSNVSTLGAASGGVRLDFYDAKQNLVGSNALLSGNQTFKYAWNAGKYYVKVSPVVSGSSVKYSISADADIFPAVTANDSLAHFTAGTLAVTKLQDNGSGASLTFDGWVGFQDAEDFYRISSKGAASTVIAIGGLTCATTVSLYDKNKKLVKTLVMSSNGVFYDGFLGKDYYLGFTSGDKGGGVYNTNYTVTISSTYAAVDTKPNNSFADADAAAEILQPSNQVSGWVGEGDTSDFYKFTYNGTEKITLSISGLTANLKLIVYNSSKVALWGGYVSVDGTYIKNLQVSGDFYVEVGSADNGATQSSNYNISISANVPVTIVQVPDPKINDDAFTGSFTGAASDMLLLAEDSKAAIYSSSGLWTEINYGGDWEVAGVADFNGDGKADILRKNDSGLVIGDFSNGDKTFTPAVLNSLGAGWDIEGTGDFNGDGIADVLLANPTAASATVGLLGYWKGGTEWTLIDGYSDEWDIEAVGDFNGDGKSDMLWKNSFIGSNGKESNAYCTWIMDSSDSWRMVSVADPAEWTFLCAGDFDGNNVSDIAMINKDGVVGIWGVADGTMNSWSIISAVDDAVWELSGVGDFNGDGTDDIAWRNCATGVTGYWQIKDKELESWQSIGVIA